MGCLDVCVVRWVGCVFTCVPMRVCISLGRSKMRELWTGRSIACAGGYGELSCEWGVCVSVCVCVHARAPARGVQCVTAGALRRASPVWVCVCGCGCGMGRPRTGAAPEGEASALRDSPACPGSGALGGEAWEVRSRYSSPAAVRAGRPSPRGPRAPGPRLRGAGGDLGGPPAAAEGSRRRSRRREPAALTSLPAGGPAQSRSELANERREAANPPRPPRPAPSRGPQPS